MNPSEMTLEQLQAEIAKRKEAAARNEAMPPPVTLSPEHADKAAGLKKLINAVDVVVGFFNSTIPEINEAMWADFKTAYGLNTDDFEWAVEDGVLQPSPKSATARLDELVAQLPVVKQDFADAARAAGHQIA